MTDAELWATWRLWVAIAGVLVLVAAGLLISIWLTAQRILAEAVRALGAAEKIEANTRAIWELQKTNEVGDRMLDTVRSIEQKTTSLAKALEGEAVPRR